MHRPCLCFLFLCGDSFRLVASVLVQKGRLVRGNCIVAENAFAKVQPFCVQSSPVVLQVSLSQCGSVFPDM